MFLGNRCLFHVFFYYMQKYIKIYLKSTKISNIDFFTEVFLENTKKIGINIHIIPMPTKIKRISVYSSPHVYKKFKDHYEVRIYKRAIKIDANQQFLKLIPLILKKKPFEVNCKITSI